MKTTRTLSRLLLAFVLAPFALTSCLDTDDPAFQIAAAAAIVYQETSPDPDGTEGPLTETYTYTPYFQIGNYNYAITSCNCTGGPEGNIPMTAMAGMSYFFWESDASSTRNYPADTYTFTATSDEGETAQCQATISACDPIGYLNVTELSYSDGQITAKWDKATNADVYIVGLRRVGEILPVYSRQYTDAQYSAEGVKVDISSASISGTFEVIVGAYATVSTAYGNVAQIFTVGNRTASATIN